MILYHNDNYQPATSPLFTSTNRSLRYGDGLFETIAVFQQKAPLLNLHINRLLKGMTALKMHRPTHFHPTFFQQIITQLLAKNGQLQNACIRLMVYRAGKGKYQPIQSNVGLLIECTPLPTSQFQLNPQGLTIGLFEEIPKSMHSLANFKTNNALIYILAAIYQQEQNWDDCLLVNTDGAIIEASSSNIFTVKNRVIYTPPLSNGCVAGVMRQYMIALIKELNMPIYEIKYSHQTLIDADEIWLTNAVKGIQWVKHYKMNTYGNSLASQIVEELNASLKG